MNVVVCYNLKLDGLALKLDGADLEIDTDCADVALGVCVIGKSKKKATLAHTRVSDKKKLEKIVAAQMHINIKRKKKLRNG